MAKIRLFVRFRKVTVAILLRLSLLESCSKCLVLVIESCIGLLRMVG